MNARPPDAKEKLKDLTKSNVFTNQLYVTITKNALLILVTTKKDANSPSKPTKMSALNLAKRILTVQPLKPLKIFQRDASKQFATKQLEAARELKDLIEQTVEINVISPKTAHKLISELFAASRLERNLAAITNVKPT